LRDLVVEGEARLEDAIVKHNKTVLSFAETIQCIVHTSSYDTNKRLRTDDGVGNDGRVEGVDLYIDSLMEHKKEECEKMIESLKSAHKKEILRLQAKVDRPVNEFRINKQFHIREDELKREIGRLKYRLDEARKQAAASEWDEREKMFLKKDIGEMKKRCSDRDQLLARIEELESQVRRFEDMLLEGNTRGETDEQLLERIEALTVMMILIKFELFIV
jgi:predicted RNase H-like nuclease (RuvC/YqgF family)